MTSAEAAHVPLIGVYKSVSTLASAIPQPEAELKFGPNITEWPKIPALLADNLLMQVASVLRDPVTTTDELIPPGRPLPTAPTPEAGVLRPVPPGPGLRPRAQATQALETGRQAGVPAPRSRPSWNSWARRTWPPQAYQIGSVIFANKPGDGSAREQAASCQRVLGGCANICYEFATKRYRSNCVNWGMLPLLWPRGEDFPCAPGDYIFVPDVKAKVLAGRTPSPALALTGGGSQAPHLYLKNTHRRGAGAAAHRLSYESLRRAEQGLRRNPWNPSKCKTPSWKSTGTR